MKRLLIILSGLILSGTLLFAQKTPDVCLTPSVDGSPRFEAVQKVIRERNAYQVEIHTMLCNRTAKPRKASVTVKVLDARGKLVNSRKETVKIEAGSAKPYATFIPIDKPHIWDGTGAPYQYKVTVAVKKDYSEAGFYFRQETL
jgi:hypothetical protein